MWLWLIRQIFVLSSLVDPSRGQFQVFYPPNPQVIWGGSSFTLTAGPAAFTGAAAYDKTYLTPPPPQDPPPSTNVSVFLPPGGLPNMSIPQSGAFAGFSIEMSVATQIRESNVHKTSPLLRNALSSWEKQVSRRCVPPCAEDQPNPSLSTILFVPFLNLLSNIVARAGWVQVRVGGNTQEAAELKDTLPNGTILAKDKANIFNPTGTPPLEYTRDLVYMMGNISALVNVRWYTGRLHRMRITTTTLSVSSGSGIPFFQLDPISLDMALLAQEVLGDNLIALQAGNEPDLYIAKGRTHRAPASVFRTD